AIINLLRELEIYGMQYANSHQYTYGSSYSDDTNPIRIAGLDARIPDPIVTDPVNHIVLDRRIITNTTSNSLEGVFSFSNAYTSRTSSQTRDGVTAGTNITGKYFANLFFEQVGLSGRIAFEGAVTNENKYTLDATQDFRDSQTIRVPPFHRATGVYTLEQGAFEKMTVLECVVSGNGIIRYYRTLPDNSYTEIVQRVNIIDVLQANGTPGFTISKEQNRAYFTGEGTISGQIGLQTFIDVVIEPLPGHA
uniref:non-toxic crystal protein n=1 Tax=Bacillus thuringiensis TaxID=1428 RepID=UPI000068391B|nr:Chain A, non-toxic crystal protein [Bacillus thuringiensis]2D42_B Chain B, non-toxic crystal protein [Bacillus thuringiensis]